MTKQTFPFLILILLLRESNYYHTFVLGDEEGATIKVQSLHYEKSELIRNESTNFRVMYYYKPIKGTDRVINHIIFLPLKRF